MGWFGPSKKDLREERDQIARRLVRLQNDVTTALMRMGWSSEYNGDFGTGEELIKYASTLASDVDGLRRQVREAEDRAEHKLMELRRDKEAEVEQLLRSIHEERLGSESCNCLPRAVCPKCSRQKLGIQL